MKKLQQVLLTGFFLGLVSFSFGQQIPYSIRGKLMNKTQQPIEAATVNLFRSNDSVAIKTVISATDGGFVIDLHQKGDYRITVTASGFKKYQSAEIAITENQAVHTLNSIVMEAETKQLDEVTVTSKKPFIEQRIDKMIVNVDAQISNAGSTAMEVLEKSPGVTVDKDGVIALKGKQQVLVYIDGRPTYIVPN